MYDQRSGKELQVVNFFSRRRNNDSIWVVCRYGWKRDVKSFYVFMWTACWLMYNCTDYSVEKNAVLTNWCTVTDVVMFGNCFRFHCWLLMLSTIQNIYNSTYFKLVLNRFNAFPLWSWIHCWLLMPCVFGILLFESLSKCNNCLPNIWGVIMLRVLAWHNLC